MSSNVFGKLFRVVSFGESHGSAIGVVIDGVPSRLQLDIEAIQRQLDRRRPGQSSITTPRDESDRVEVLSGLLEGMTTGSPLAFLVKNRDTRAEDYEHLKNIFRPGHADYSWYHKYGVRDYLGGGRASGRETVARVIAGSVARQLLASQDVSITGHVKEVAGIRAESFDAAEIERNAVRCADPEAAARMIRAIEEARDAGDSVGGIVEIRATGVPAGWGEPVFEKLDALLAGALMSIGAVKGVEIGDGFKIAGKRGSEANDSIGPEGMRSNHAGGILGGVSSGAEIVVRCAIKPTSSIAMEQDTVTLTGESVQIRVRGRHDPCIAPRIVPVAEAMAALVLVDAWLQQRARENAGEA